MTSLLEPTRTGDQALKSHGMTGERLLNMCRAIANSYCRRTGSGLDSRIDDLVQHLALTATRRACNYEPAKNPSSTFASWLWDSLDPGACIDWHRRKAEGFGDRRYGLDNRVSPSDTIDTLPAPLTDEDEDDPDARWRYAAWVIQQRFSDWSTVHERRVIRWQHGADIADLPFDQYVARALDVMTRAMEKRAA